jgi:hypothetical protein
VIFIKRKWGGRRWRRGGGLEEKEVLNSAAFVRSEGSVGMATK